jgi:hypothetical protein
VLVRFSASAGRDVDHQHCERCKARQMGNGSSRGPRSQRSARFSSRQIDGFAHVELPLTPTTFLRPTAIQTSLLNDPQKRFGTCRIGPLTRNHARPHVAGQRKSAPGF